MNYSRLALATFGATAVYFALGGLVFGIGPLRKEFQRITTRRRSVIT